LNNLLNILNMNEHLKIQLALKINRYNLNC
jgi:hypothetical protein